MAKNGKALPDKEINARRENAKKSTGPRIEMGKERVSLNAVKTGYHADKVAYAAMVMLGEDPKEFAKMYTDWWAGCCPRTSGSSCRWRTWRFCDGNRTATSADRRG